MLLSEHSQHTSIVRERITHAKLQITDELQKKILGVFREAIRGEVFLSYLVRYIYGHENLRKGVNHTHRTHIKTQVENLNKNVEQFGLEIIEREEAGDIRYKIMDLI